VNRNKERGKRGGNGEVRKREKLCYREIKKLK
jgi:hypothetical protein